jgi:hypothetical protein
VKKYEITITDKQTWVTPRVWGKRKMNGEKIISKKRGIDTEDRFYVVVEADSEDEATGITREMLLDYQFDIFTSDYCVSKKDCSWWGNSMLNPKSDWNEAMEIFGDELEFDGGTTDYLVEEIE